MFRSVFRAVKRFRPVDSVQTTQNKRKSPQNYPEELVVLALAEKMAREEHAAWLECQKPKEVDGSERI